MSKFSRALIVALGACLAVSANAQVATNFDVLNKIAQQAAIEQAAAKQEAESLARIFNIPIRQVFSDGTVLELMAFERGRPVYFITDNVNAAKSISADKVHPGGSSGFGLTGSGVILGVWDGGTVRDTHQEFGGRVTKRDSEGLTDHGTHVAGTIIASGVSANAKGMSIQGQVHSWGWNSDDSEMATAAAAGLRVSNHSYGSISGWYQNGSTWYWYGDTDVDQNEDPGFGYYSNGAKAWDNIAYNAPFYLICKSAGNDRGDGPSNQPVTHKVWGGNNWVDSNTVRPKDGGTAGFDSISYDGNAKNILTVAAVNDVTNYTGPGSVVMSSFSGWGPTDDGRIKPDISGNGVSLFSAGSSSNTAYSTKSGTSMSTPNVVGGLGLLIQQYRLKNSGNDMRAATLKGLAIHTAKEAGTNPGPDYTFGWGLLDVEAGAKAIRDAADKLAVIREDTLVNAGKNTLTVIADGTAPLKVTICWTDPAGNPVAWSLDNPTRMLVNDLDLRVKSGASTHMPWVLNPASPSSAAGRSDNFRDNVEQVVVDSPSAGQTFTIEVNHKGATLAPSGQQAYSLIVTGGKVPLRTIKNFSLLPNSVQGGSAVTGFVELETAAGAGGQVVEIGDNSTAISTPPSVTVPAGSTSQSFLINTSEVGATYVRQVWAKVNDEQVNANLTLTPPMKLTNFTANPSTVYGGQTSVGTLTINQPAPTGGTTVNVSSGSTVIVVPSTVVIDEGTSSKNFDIQTLNVSSTVIRFVTASVGGSVKSVGITIQPAVKLSTFIVTPSAVEGGNTIVGTLGLNFPAPPGGAAVTITSGSVMFQVPSQVTIAAGNTTGNFNIGVLPSTQTVTRMITASYGGVSRMVAITIYPTAKLSSFTANPTTVVGGQNTTGTINLSAPAPPGGSVVNLSTASTVINIPSSVTVPEGQLSTTFTIGTDPVSTTVVRSLSATKGDVTKIVNLTITPP